jgi:hypothetical protein
MATLQERRITIERTGLKYGLLLAGANTGFFLLMALFGLETYTWLRFVNLVFIFLIVYKGLQFYKHHTQGYWTYLKGLGLGTYILLVGALLFSIFLGIYSLLNPDFVESLKNNQSVVSFFNPFVLAVVSFLETMIYGFILTFACMQRLKTSHMKDSVHNF